MTTDDPNLLSWEELTGSRREDSIMIIRSTTTRLAPAVLEVVISKKRYKNFKRNQYVAVIKSAANGKALFKSSESYNNLEEVVNALALVLHGHEVEKRVGTQTIRIGWAPQTTEDQKIALQGIR